MPAKLLHPGQPKTDFLLCIPSNFLFFFFSNSASQGGSNGLGKGFVAGTVQRFGLTRQKSGSSARKRASEFNIFGDSDIVSADYTIESLQESQKNATVTKLELEDIVNRDDDRHAEVFEAVKNLLKNDGGRKWKYVKFIDSIRIGDLGEKASYVRHYESQRMELWNLIDEYSKGKPIMFELKIEVEENTSVRTIIELLTEVQKLNLAKVEWMGGLLGITPPQLGDELANLCKPEFDGNIEEDGELSEMIMFHLEYVSQEVESEKKNKIWKKALRRCVLRLKGISSSSAGDTPESQLSAMRAATSTSRSRTLSPRRAAVRSLSGDIKKLNVSVSPTTEVPERKLLARGSVESSSDGHLSDKQRKPRKISSQEEEGKAGPKKPGRVKRAVTAPIGPPARSRGLSPAKKGSPKQKSKVERANSRKEDASYDWDEHAKTNADSVLLA